VNEPLVSIVIPCYRGRKYLREAIESCLRQTHRNLEVIVVDDKSPDADYEIAEELARTDPRVRVIRRTENGRICRALNTGYGAARGEYFARLAQDDMFREDAVALLLRRLQDHPGAGLAYADMQLIDASGKYMQLMPTAPDPARALMPVDRVGLCVMWPRAVWDAVGPFDPRYDLCDDYEFFLRISRKFPLTRVPDEAPFFFRYHPEQGSVTKAQQHDIAGCRVHLAHNWALLRGRWYSPVLWKRVACGWVRLTACRAGLYRYWKYDGASLFKGRS
jgi:glycosyltransferase involved in cell wall biosynthesis